MYNVFDCNPRFQIKKEKEKRIMMIYDMIWSIRIPSMYFPIQRLPEKLLNRRQIKQPNMTRTMNQITMSLSVHHATHIVSLGQPHLQVPN